MLCLKSETKTWSQPTICGTRPHRRRYHSAALIQNNYMLIFGGGDDYTFFDDFHVLNLGKKILCVALILYKKLINIEHFLIESSFSKNLRIIIMI
jgi:hypothetical protein